MGIQERGFKKRTPEHLDACERVREWTRGRFALPGEASILVTEIACALPGCPPLETVIAFWDSDARYHFKIFKPVIEIVNDDLPFPWQKDSLAVPVDFVCDCC
jgi:hypothetical protein